MLNFDDVVNNIRDAHQQREDFQLQLVSEIQELRNKMLLVYAKYKIIDYVSARSDESIILHTDGAMDFSDMDCGFDARFRLKHSDLEFIANKIPGLGIDSVIDEDFESLYVKECAKLCEEPISE